MNIAHSHVIAGLLCISITSAAVAEQVVIERVYVKRIREVEVAALKQGVLSALSVQEGSSVVRDQELARIDDRQAILELSNAKLQSEVAEHKAQDQAGIELAEKTLDKEIQALKQARLESRLVHRTAGNLLAIQAAEKSRDVAKNELDRALKARAEFEDAVSESEIDGLRLAYQRAELDAKQAVFEQEQQVLTADASDEVVRLQELAIEQSEIAVQQSRSALVVSQLESRLMQSQLASAELNLENHRIRSSIDGVVVELLKQEGEWIRPGEVVMRVLRLNRLRVEGFLPQHEVSNDFVGREVTITIQGIDSKVNEFKGTLTFVSPTVDAVNQEVAVWAEFDNPSRVVRPGMQGAMTIGTSEPSRAVLEKK